MKKNPISSILSILIMITLGTLVGMLFSPTSGNNIRSVLLYKLEGFLKKMKSLLLHMLELPYQSKIQNDGKVASQEIINQTISKAKQLLEEVEELSENLETQSSSSLA